MLVLSRRKDETIMIGDEVEITIVDVRGDTVRLGIKAPRSVSVHRKEIYDAIQAENIAAAQESVPDQSAVGGLGSLLKGDAVRPSALGKLTGGLAGPLAGAGAVSKPAGLDKLMSGLAKARPSQPAGAEPPPAAPATPAKPGGLDRLLSRLTKAAPAPEPPPSEPETPPKPDTTVRAPSRSTKVTRPRKPRSSE